MDWKSMPNGQEKRHAYYASREWALLKNAVRERCGGICEVCKNNPMQATHHLTYIRLYNERLTDLQGICEDCHEFQSGRKAKGQFHYYRIPGIAEYMPIATGTGIGQAILYFDRAYFDARCFDQLEHEEASTKAAEQVVQLESDLAERFKVSVWESAPIVIDVLTKHNSEWLWVSVLGMAPAYAKDFDSEVDDSVIFCRSTTQIQWKELAEK